MVTRSVNFEVVTDALLSVVSPIDDTEKYFGLKTVISVEVAIS